MQQEVIKVRFTGKLRSRLNERYDAYAAEEKAEDNDHKQAQRARDALNRQKTNIVCHSEAEAEAVIAALEMFTGRSGRQVTWTNGSMRSAAERVTGELREQINRD